MNRIIIILAAFAAVIVFSSCNMMAGSGVIVETEFEITGFKSIEAGSVCDLIVTKGNEFNVIVTSDDNLVDFLDVKLVSDQLLIQLRPYTNYNNVTFKVSVIMPELESVKLSGASEMNVSGFEAAGRFNVNVSGASRGTINLLSAEEINAVVSGASNLKMSANIMSGDLAVECSGASKADLRACEANNVQAEISGASSAWVYSKGSLTGSASGASKLYYGVNPNLSGMDIDITSELKRY